MAFGGGRTALHPTASVGGPGCSPRSPACHTASLLTLSLPGGWEVVSRAV